MTMSPDVATCGTMNTFPGTCVIFHIFLDLQNINNT
eukprot:CAMPEP_0194443482 /NCGR_PEP_ID=MMETSP0176-20130528/126731_1 /TAXON_ID=216777 /ORGANISM="Proboscia alata, Strain PI-D3" /LENGTH=35 /DNA_ID= /DNA_START= /DNA_END= /DNA_ORIENTATION=